MSRVQLALRVADLEGSIAFYSKLFGAEPAKRRPGYANFAIAESPLKLVLIEGAPGEPTPGEPTRLDHLGVEVLLRSHRDGGRHRPARGGGLLLTPRPRPAAVRMITVLQCWCERRSDAVRVGGRPDGDRGDDRLLLRPGRAR